MYEYFDRIEELAANEDEKYRGVAESARSLLRRSTESEWVTSSIPCSNVRNDDCTTNQRMFRNCLLHIDATHKDLSLPCFVSPGQVVSSMDELHSIAKVLAEVAEQCVSNYEIVNNKVQDELGHKLSCIDRNIDFKGAWLSRNYRNYCTLLTYIGLLCMPGSAYASTLDRIVSNIGDSEVFTKMREQLEHRGSSEDISWLYIVHSLYRIYDMLRFTRKQLSMRLY